MIFLSEDALRYVKRWHIKNCIGAFMLGGVMYAFYTMLVAEFEEIENLTKKVEELSSKGE